MFWAKFSPVTRGVTLVDSELNFVHWKKHSSYSFWFLWKRKKKKKSSYKVFPIQFISCCMQMTSGQFPVKLLETWSYSACWDGERQSGAGSQRRGEKQQSASSRFWKVEQIHRTAPDCYFKGRDTGLLRGNCTWTCCAEEQEKAYNLRSALIVLKAFSGMRNTKFSALLVEKYMFGGLFLSQKMLVSFMETWGSSYPDLQL